MRVRVLMFGALAEAASREDLFDLGDRPCVGDVIGAVRSRYPDAAPIVDRCSVAVDHEVVGRTHPVSPSSEVALLPPMSGGGVTVRLTGSPSVDAVLGAVSSPAAGGTAVFVGTVRDRCEAGPVDRLVYSAYTSMAGDVMREIAAEASEKWGLHGVAIEHAVGSRRVGEVTFVVACAGAHREEAFEACRHVVEEVKRRMPVWKKEIGPWGERWVGL